MDSSSTMVRPHFSTAQPEFEVVLTDVAMEVCEALNMSQADYVRYATPDAAAIDLRVATVSNYAPVTEFPVFAVGSTNTKGWILYKGALCTVHTGIKLFPTAKDGRRYVGLAIPRSGLGSRGLQLRNTVGVIDPDYQGEILLNIRNVGNEDIEIKQGDRIAQLLLTPVTQGLFSVVTEFSSRTERGDGGFSSTGTGV